MPFDPNNPYFLESITDPYGDCEDCGSFDPTNPYGNGTIVDPYEDCLLDSSWAYRRKITIDNTNIDSDITYFPIPIVLGVAVGQSDQDVTDIFDELGSEFKKIAITKSDGITQIYAEVEQWDVGNEKAVIWVSKSDLIIMTASVTELYIYYDSTKVDNTTYIGTPGNRIEVWDINYKGVFHLCGSYDGTSEEVKNSADSTNLTAGNLSGNFPVQATGMLLSKGQEFTPNQDIGGDIYDATGDSEFQIDSYIIPNAVSSYRNIVSNCNADNGNNAGILQRIKNGKYELILHGENSGKTVIGPSLISDTEYFLSSAYDSTNGFSLFVNGNEEATDNQVGLVGDRCRKNWEIGYRGQSYPRAFDGIIDEVRLSNIKRSNAWRKADYYAQTDNLLTFGAIDGSPNPLQPYLCETFDPVNPYDNDIIVDPYEDCNTGCPWLPWIEGEDDFYYVYFPVSSYITREWTAETERDWDHTYIAPTTDNGFYYKIRSEGTTGETEPNWPTLFGETVVDGGVTWECWGYRTMTGDYMSENGSPGVRQVIKFGDYILTLSEDYVLECWDAIPNYLGKKDPTTNVTLVWRQHVRTFEGLGFDEYLGLIVTPGDEMIFLDTEDGWNGDAVNWLDTEGNFIKYTRLRTKYQKGTRLQNVNNFCVSHTETTIILYTISKYDNDLDKVTYEYVSPGVYSPTTHDSIIYADLELGVGSINNLYTPTKATVTLDGTTVQSLATLNADGSITVIDTVDEAWWESELKDYASRRWGNYVAIVQDDYLLVTPADKSKGQFVLCEPNTINPIKYG